MRNEKKRRSKRKKKKHLRGMGLLKSPPRISNPKPELPVEPTTSTSPQVLLSNSAISTIPDQHFSCAPGLSMNYDSNLLRRQHDLLPNCSLAVIARHIGIGSLDPKPHSLDVE